MKKHNKILKTLLIAATAVISIGSLKAQTKASSDSTQVKESDRNVMLNAASANAGPREVNIGLPASVGGTTVLENGLPVVYFFWPEFPYKSWRIDAMTNGVKLYDLGQTAINTGDVGFSVGTTNKLGSDNFMGNAAINSNHFGLLNGTVAVSGPLGKTGLKYAAGAFLNYDPGTYNVSKNKIDRYFSDQTQLYKFALTKDYTFGDGGTGSFSAFYKYASSKSMAMQQYAPYRYFSDGSVKQLDNFKIGGDNYQVGQKVRLQDAFTGQWVERDVLNDYGSVSHTLDLIGKNKFANGLTFNYTVRGHNANSGVYLPLMTGISTKDAEGNAITPKQGVLILASRRTPIKSLTSLFEIGKKSGKHDWTIGLNQWLYNIDKFVTEGTTYNQSVTANPEYLGGGGSLYEYHNGTENKTAIILTDKWEATNLLTLTAGTRLEYQSLRGDYINQKDNGNANPDEGYITTAKKTDIKKDWINKSFMFNGVYKVTNRFGLLGEVTYNEESGHLNNYSAGIDPELKKSHIPGAAIGLFYNHPMLNIVSKVTYIQRDEYRNVINFTNPTTNEVTRYLGHYDIKTLGWTTDVVASPFKNFSIHALLTVQSPKYNNFSGSVDFQSGAVRNFDFSGNIVTGVSKVLIEIDPSYKWDKFKVWGSARYFSTQYANMSNSLTFKGRWETFAGVNYAASKFLDVNFTVINLLNQRGAQGTISGTDLMTPEEVKKMVNEDGLVMSGTYIRPFTVEFGAKVRF